MYITINQMKPFALLLAIVVGLTLNCTKAYAGKNRSHGRGRRLFFGVSNPILKAFPE